MKKLKLTSLALLAPLLLSLISCTGVKLDEFTVVKQLKPRENTTGFVFPVGYKSFHEDQSINYLLNRLYSLGYAPADDLIMAGNRITDFISVQTVMKEFAITASKEGRYMNAAFYFRTAEFYTKWDDPNKIPLYNQFVDNFYQSIKMDSYEVANVPYENGKISALRIEAEVPEPRGTIILHAGYDGFKEEIYSAMRFLASHGYNVISFDVPWMDRSNGQSVEGFSYKWERVVGAILDHYNETDVTLIGVSFGGWLALRAAALEPRISRVVASSVSYDINQYAGWFSQMFAQFALKNMSKFANKQILKQMESDPQVAWYFDQLMHITRKSSPIEAAKILSQINAENLHSELVAQDVLILTGLDDHLVPFKMHKLQVDALVNAKSVKPLVFTDEVQGQNHCQMGNFGLALDSIPVWLDEIDK